MSYSVVITDSAKEDLRKIALWIAEQSKNIDIAKKFVMELQSECLSLDVFPESGALPRDRVLLSAGYRFKAYQDYLIFYLIDKDNFKVNIVAIFNSKKDYIRVMKPML